MSELFSDREFSLCVLIVLFVLFIHCLRYRDKTINSLFTLLISVSGISLFSIFDYLFAVGIFIPAIAIYLAYYNLLNLNGVDEK